MCTLVILRRPGHDWPVLIAANRDEMLDRAWRGPDRYWADRPDVIAGLDELAGGTWLGVNDYGVAAGILNRKGSLGPAENKRSRGELVLEALDHADAGSAAESLAYLNSGAYRPFNLVVADSEEAFWLRHDGKGPIRFEEIPPGLSMITAHDLNARESARIRSYLPLFHEAPTPDPDSGDWTGWEALLADRDGGDTEEVENAMCVTTDFRFGTVNASLIALPDPARRPEPAIWRFADGPPGEVSFVTIKA